MWINKFGALLSVVLGKQSFDWNLGKARISVVAIEIGVGQFHGFDFLVQLGCAKWAFGGSRRHLHNVQHFERCHALAVGRKLIYRPIAIGDGDRFHPLWRKLSQIRRRYRPPKRLRRTENGLGNLSAVKRICALLSNQSQCLGQIMVLKNFPNSRRLVVVQKHTAAFAVTKQILGRILPEPVNQFREGISLVGIENRSLKNVLPGEPSKAFVQCAPSRDGAGDGHAIDSRLRHGSRGFSLQVVDRKALRRPSAGVQSVELSCLGLPVEGEQIATHAVHHGFGDAQNGVGSDGSVRG